MPELNEADLAARYGWSMAVLNSSPDLKNLFSRAVAETWTPEKFTAELRNTGWYKANGEAARQASVLRSTDPATWNQRVANQIANVQQMATQMGAILAPGMIGQIAENVITYGWNDNNLRQALSGYVKYSGGLLHGQAAANESELRKYASSMGVRVSNKTIAAWAGQAASGMGSLDSAMGQVRKLAEQAFPQFSERFRAGETFDQIADPYKQSMAQLLELSPEAIDNFDPTVRAALSAKDAKSGKPASKTLWEFENDLRKDGRWAKTNNAREAGMNAVNGILQSFGLIS